MPGRLRCRCPLFLPHGEGAARPEIHRPSSWRSSSCHPSRLAAIGDRAANRGRVRLRKILCARYVTPPPAGCPMTRWQRDVPPLEWMACHLSECRHRGRKALHGCGKLAGAISRASCSCLHFINHDVRAGGKNRHDPERGVLTPDKGRRISRPSTTAAALPDGRTVRPQIFLVRALMLSGVGLIDLAL